MNREIEFRGFDGIKWYYGDLEYNRRTDVAMIHTYGDGGSYNKQYTVDPDTVGQFTGMRDKNGRKIYEGDVVRVYDFSSVYASEYKGVVKMVYCTWIVEYNSTFGISRPKLFFDDFADRKTEVIGNIYENPELLDNKSK